MERIINLSISLLLLLLMVSCDDESASPKIETGLLADQELISGGTTRFYDLYLPSTFSNSEQLPLVIDLHGALLTRGNQRGISGFEAIAERENFIVVFPSGLMGAIGPPVNMTNWRWDYNLSSSKDFDFLNQLIDELIETYGVDPSRIYLSGFSMGGIMSYAMACKFGDRIAAIGVVAGGMTESMMTDCNPSRAMPVMHIHGTDDAIALYEGSDENPSVESGILYWVDQSGCSESPTINMIPGTVVNVQSYCDQEKVELVVVEKGGHNWPGSQSTLFNNSSAGNVNMDINASEMLWSFLKKHSHPNPQ